MRSLIIMIIALLFLSGCVQEVKPWEKDNLAKDTMKNGGSNSLIKKYEEHIFYSREASKGGSGVAGGGCGCN